MQDYSGIPVEKTSWSNMTYRLDSIPYYGILAFNPPSQGGNTQGLFGQGTTKVGFGVGNKDIPEATLEMYQDDYDEFYLDKTGGDPSKPILNEPLVIQRISEIWNDSAKTSLKKRKTTTYDCRIKTIAEEGESQGNTGFKVTITLEVVKVSDPIIERP